MRTLKGDGFQQVRMWQGAVGVTPVGATWSVPKILIRYVRTSTEYVASLILADSVLTVFVL